MLKRVILFAILMAATPSLGDERNDRAVDRVALAAQTHAVTQLAGLLKRYRGTSQEPVFLEKLADLEQQQGALYFRIGRGHDLKPHHQAMAASIHALDSLIARFPSYEDLPHAYFLRGHAYEENEDKKSAERDYLHLVERYPDAEEAPTAYMSLAQFAIDANQHERAIGFLKQVEKLPEDPHYPYALYKMAWSYFNLKNIPQALAYAERHIRFTVGDATLRDNTLLDVPVFFFEGYEEGKPEYAVARAYDYFLGLEQGPQFGRMALRFAKLLRSHDHEAELTSWARLLVARAPARGDTLDVELLAFELQLNKREYLKLADGARDIVALYGASHGFQGFKSADRARKLLIDTATALQGLILKNKDATEVKPYSAALAALYDSFTRVVSEDDPRVPRAHFNLAETLYAIHDYDGATTHYRWVVEHPRVSREPARARAKLVADAAVRAVAARYVALQKENLIPDKLDPRPMGDDRPRGSLAPRLGEWVTWVRELEDHDADASDLDRFSFEASRALYAARRLNEAVDRLERFPEDRLESSYAEKSASLALDTWVASQDWVRVNELAERFLALWKPEEPFHAKLLALASDAFYKRAEAASRAGDGKRVLKLADAFLERYAASDRLGDCLAIAGRAALDQKDDARAERYYARLIALGARAPDFAGALAARAAIEERSARFTEASADVRALIASKAKPDEDLRAKALALSWLDADSSALVDPRVCRPDGAAADCARYEALALLDGLTFPNAPGSAKERLERARSAKDDAKAAWAAAALETAADLSFYDRLTAVRALASSWGDADPAVQFALLPRISTSVPRAFALEARAIAKYAPLKADERSIAHRVEVVRAVESAAARAMKLPWARVRAATLDTLAGLYVDLAHDLDALPEPRGLSSQDLAAYQDTVHKLTLPFDEKGQELRSKAFDLASNAAIEADAFAPISSAFFAANPTQAAALRKPMTSARDRLGSAPPPPIDLALLDRLDPDSNWDSAPSKLPADALARTRTLWARALKAHLWPEVAFYLDQAKKQSAKPGTLAVMRAASFAAAGAQAEALASLDEARSRLGDRGRARADRVLAAYYAQALAWPRADGYLNEVEPTAQKLTFLQR